jgi:hypothetical protein
MIEVNGCGCIKKYNAFVGWYWQLCRTHEVVLETMINKAKSDWIMRNL